MYGIFTNRIWYCVPADAVWIVCAKESYREVLVGATRGVAAGVMAASNCSIANVTPVVHIVATD